MTVCPIIKANNKKNVCLISLNALNEYFCKVGSQMVRHGTKCSYDTNSSDHMFRNSRGNSEFSNFVPIFYNLFFGHEGNTQNYTSVPQKIINYKFFRKL